MMLYRALDVVMPRFRTIFREFGLTEQQWRVLRVLWELDSVPFRELARLTLIPRPSLVGIVDRLEVLGLVGRRRDENDRRGVFVVITQDARSLQEQIMPRVDHAYRELRGSVDPEVWKQLLDGLKRISRVDDRSDARNAVVNG